jgi:hypothetical protein
MKSRNGAFGYGESVVEPLQQVVWCDVIVQPPAQRRPYAANTALAAVALPIEFE